MRTIAYADISPVLRWAVEPLIDKWEHVLPDWCRLLTVREGDGEPVAMFTCDVSRRRATILVYPIIMAQSDIESVIVHELCHAYTTPCSIAAKEYLNATKLDPEGAEYKTVWDRIEDQVEAATCDLTTLVMRLAG